MTSEPACDLCGGRDIALLYALDRSIHRCTSCGLVLSADALAGTEPRDAYDETFWSDPYWAEQSGDWRRSPDAALYRELLARAHELGARAGRLLDVGCGVGTFLAAARDAGFDVHGVDVSPLAGEACRRNVPTATVEMRDVVNEPFPPASFDVVAMLDVLEHVASPRRLLASVRDMLRPGGLLLLRTINEATVLNVLGGALYRLGRTGAAQRMHERYHLVYFDRRQLTRYLDDAGFHVRWRRGGEIALRRLGLSPLVRWGVMAPVYGLQRWLGMQYEQVLVATKDPGDGATASVRDAGG